MKRVTTKQSDGTYTSKLTRKELIELVGKMEDKKSGADTLPIDTKVFLVRLVNGSCKYQTVEGTIIKSYNSKKYGIRYDVAVDFAGYDFATAYVDRIEAREIYTNKADADKVAAELTEWCEAENRRHRFCHKLQEAYHNDELSLDIVTNAEEAKWFAEWVENRNVEKTIEYWNKCMQTNTDNLRDLVDRLGTAGFTRHTIADLNSILEERRYCLKNSVKVEKLAELLKKDVRRIVPDWTELAGKVKDSLATMFDGIMLGNDLT